MTLTWLSPQETEMLVRLGLATIFGSLLGIEREIHGKVAGFRTHALVALGSALVMIVSIDIFEVYRNVATVDPSRIAAQVVSGIGFLGAGAILRFRSGVTGLTTAASLWLSAGIGLACGAGFLKPALVATGLGLFVAAVFGTVGKGLGWKYV